jgi:hypothetical protein
MMVHEDVADLRLPLEPPAWPYTTRATAVRLFLTCWLVFTIHFASNTVREVYLALAIGDHLSFRVDDYAHMHPDLFEKPGFGWHIGANPGASMVAAVPYALSKPVIDRVVERVNQSRRAEGRSEPPPYDSPWPMARDFYRESWRRGYDVKFGLGALVMQAFAQAPISALGVAAMFYLLRRLFASDRIALWLSVLYAFGTPVFFRAGYLNHNMMLGHLAFLGFLTMWDPGKAHWGSSGLRYALGGLAGGAALLFDYSGVVLLLGLFFYGLGKRFQLTGSVRDALRHGGFYILGTLAPIFLLWFYQYESFGNAFLPGQHWMPPVEWIERGYQGFGPPQLDLLKSLAFDYRYGFFTTCPLFLLALAAPWLDRGRRRVLPVYETVFLLAVAVAFWLFCGGINYTRLQFNTGIRYLAPIFPFLFVPAAAALMRLPRPAVFFIGVLSIAQAWCLAMYRDVERGLGLLDPVLHVLFGGFTLPILSVLSRMGSQYGDYFAHGVSPLPVFAVAAALLFGLWWPRLWRARA